MIHGYKRRKDGYVGTVVGTSVGTAVLSLHGVGALVGSLVGVGVGGIVGRAVGVMVGGLDGLSVIGVRDGSTVVGGSVIGSFVGIGVGAELTPPQTLLATCPIPHKDITAEHHKGQWEQ